MANGQEETTHLFQEQTWFSLTTVTVNGFLVVTDQIHWALGMIASVIISIHAIGLVAERARPNRKDLDPGSKLRFVFGERSGALFYVLVIVWSMLGVLIAGGTRAYTGPASDQTKCCDRHINPVVQTVVVNPVQDKHADVAPAVVPISP